MTEYTESLYKVMRQPTKELPPVFIYRDGNFIFNGVNYGSNEGAANKARRKYFNKLKSVQ